MRDLVGSLRAKLSALAAAVTSEVDDMEDNLSQTATTLSSTKSDDDTTEVEAEEPPSFGEIFPGGAKEVDITDDVFESEPEPVARVSARPWERG